MKKTLLVGCRGSIGRRYAAILAHLNQPYLGIDLNDPEPEGHFTHAIIATPTSTHLELARKYSDFMPVLVEKPLCTDELQLSEWKALKSRHPIYMVNNYSFLNTNPGFPPRVDKIEYNFYNTGRDGTAFDCIQLLYLGQKIGAEVEIYKTSPVWDLWINDKLKVPYEWIEWSYVQMINAFISDRTQNLWPLSYGIEATELALQIYLKMEDKHAGTSCGPGQIKQPKTA